MTLEDFFTLTEMKDGLTATARVEELIAVMKKEKDSIVKNVGDATRQWSAVSSTIAATDNKDCLDLFIQLDGLWFINIWLKDAQKLDTDTSESFVEEAITAMLGALEKLHIDVDMSISTGICITVKNLLNHSSSRIQDRAKVLCGRWKLGASLTDNTVHQDVEITEGSHDDVIIVREALTAGSKPESSALSIPVPEECDKEGNFSVKSTRDEVLPSKSSDDLQTGNVEDSGRHAPDSNLNICSAIKNRGPLLTIQATTSTREEPQVSTKEATLSVKSSASSPGQQSVALVGDQNLTVSTNNVNKSPEESGARDLSAGSSVLEPGAVRLGIGVANVQEYTGEPSLRSNVGANEGEGVTLESNKESGVDDMGVPTCSNSWSSKTASQKAEGCTLLQDSSGKQQHILAISMDRGTSFSKMEDCESPLRKECSPCFDTEPMNVLIKERKEESSSDADEDPTSAPKISKSVNDAKSPDFTDKRRPDIELDHGIVDALEVARKVAQEVVDYRGPSCCSSSDRASKGGIAQPCGSDSINGKEGQAVPGLPEEIPANQKLSLEGYRQGGEHVVKSDYVDTEPENCLPGMESSQVTEAAQEPEANSERGAMCGFDLNQEICSDDMDHPVDSISTTISAVSASRPTVSPGLPVAPLHFEGTLGWKGSALTSAFRPASPRRISDGGSSNSSKCRQDHLDFDLNVAGDGEDKFIEQTSGKQVHAFFGLPSGESSVEISSKKPERLKLDLNSIGDDGDAPSADIRMEGQLFLHQNGRRSPSPASSSSSMHPSMRNIDLNNRPYIQNGSSQLGPYHSNLLQNVNAYGGTKPDDPVISIMGARVEVKRNDFVPQTLSLSNGKAPEIAMDANVARTAAFLGMGPTVSYTHPPAFGYNGFTAGPTMSFSSPMYGAGGSVPYMVDSRGAPFVPQVAGSAQQPFIMSMTSAPQGMNGLGLSRPNFDLNSGFMFDGVNKESSGGLRQLFISGQGRPMDEHLRGNLMSSSSVVGTKRKEPDTGWEPFSLNYKHQQPPWK